VGASVIVALFAGTANAQTPAAGATKPSALPPISVEEPGARRQRQSMSTTRPARGTRATVRRTASRSQPPAAAPQPAVQPVNPTSTMGAQPAYAGGQVARGGQVGVLGSVDYMSAPFSTQSFTQQFIENRQATTIQDVLLYDPSISAAQGGSRAAVDYVRFRGFPNYAGQEQSAVNGLAGVSGYLVPSPEFLQRLELIKGANAFLNGNVGAVGGSINAVTKRGPDKPVADITGTFGSTGQFGGTFDVGGRWGDNKEYGLRINGLHREGALAPLGTDSNQSGVAIGWDFRGDRFRMDADLVYRDQIFYGDPYYTSLADPAIGLPAAPRTKINLTAPWMYNAAKELLVMTRAEYDVSDNWTIAGAVGHSKSDSRFNTYCFNSISNVRGDATCYGGSSKSDYDRDAANLALRGVFNTGVVKHRFAVGGNYISEDQGAQPNLPAVAPINFNIYAPSWPSALPEPVFGPTTKQNQNTTRGAFVTDTLSILDERINFTAGVRHTQVDQANFDIVTGAQNTASSTATTTPAFGALVKITPWLSLYGNYIEALERGATAPQTAVNAGQSFAPLVSKQHEFGAKLDFTVIGATFAYFDIRKANEYTANNVFTQNGLQQNKGYEITVFGEPVNGIRFLAGASWIDARQVNTGDVQLDGKKAAAVPEYEFRLTGEVDIPAVPGLTVTGAVFHSGPAPYDNLNSFNVPAWTRADVGARYVYWIDKTKMTGRFNVENLTNEAYWIAGYGSGGLAQSGARRYLASLTASF
jgi:iron complex outermembrane receptor protein